MLVASPSQQQAIVYLRDRSAQTSVRIATLRQKLPITFSISPSHSLLTLGQPVPSLTLYCQAPGRVDNREQLNYCSKTNSKTTPPPQKKKKNKTKQNKKTKQKQQQQQQQNFKKQNKTQQQNQKRVHHAVGIEPPGTLSTPCQNILSSPTPPQLTSPGESPRTDDTTTRTYHPGVPQSRGSAREQPGGRGKEVSATLQGHSQDWLVPDMHQPYTAQLDNRDVVVCWLLHDPATG